MSLNSVNISGRLTRDPEIRYSENGMCICSFSLAVGRNFKDGNGNYGVDFINCVCFSKGAEFVGKYFTKGQQMIVSGRLQTRSYDNAEGRKVNVVEVVCNETHFADSKKESNNQQQNYNTNENPFIPTNDNSQLPF